MGEIVPVLIAFHSVYWIRVAVESYLEQFPAEKILVVDNNPQRGEADWLPHCEEERAWLATHPGVLLIDGPGGLEDRLADGRREHGAGMDAALQWCRRQGARVLLHFEPDCLVRGRRWRENLLGAIARGAWLAGGHQQSHGPIHPTPTAWRVDRVPASFKIRPWAEDEARPAFRQFVDLGRLESDSSYEAFWIRLVKYWDTGHKAWFETKIRDKAVWVETPDFKHYWGGSHARRFSEKTLSRGFPEVRPFLDRARARQEALRVEQCPFREEVTGVGWAEVATCRLVQLVSGVADRHWAAVARNACEACCESFRPDARRLNPTVASLLYGLAENVAARGGVPGCTTSDAQTLLRRVEDDLEFDLP